MLTRPGFARRSLRIAFVPIVIFLAVVVFFLVLFFLWLFPKENCGGYRVRSKSKVFSMYSVHA